MNRTREITKLTRVLGSPDPSLVVIYGRRRCGKSTLLQHVAKKTDIYFLADQQEAPLQIQSLAIEIGRTIPGFGQANYPSWEALLSVLQHQAKKGTTLIIDEFPYLVQKSPELPSIIQKLIDNQQNKTNIIICGSSQRMMQGLVLDSSAPLYGRAAEIIKVRPLEPGWIKEALSLNHIEAVEAYSVWGGVPRYWELAKTYRNQEEACKEIVLDRDGILHNEPMRLLLDDMRGASQPHSLLSLIANGSNRLSEIAGRLGKPATSLTRPLANLIELGYIKRDHPFGESPRSSKKSIYRLKDPFLLFWYRVVLPNHSLLEQDLIDAVYAESQNNFKAQAAEIWEEMARKSTAHLNIANIRWKPAQRWWGHGRDGKNMEIDIIAESLNNEFLLFGEVKWEEKTNIKATISKLKKSIANFPKQTDKKIIMAVWCKNNKIKNEECPIISPEDVLSGLK
ncbi:MAG: ATP-binding protein [Desulfobacterales bacterium]|nr:ATP-binding protein [Desulfobacterales bacterium]